MGVFSVQRLPLAVSPFHLGPHFYKPLLTVYVLTVSGVMWAVTKPPGVKGLEKVPLRRCLSFLIRSDLSPLSLHGFPGTALRAANPCRFFSILHSVSFSFALIGVPFLCLGPLLDARVFPVPVFLRTHLIFSTSFGTARVCAHCV